MKSYKDVVSTNSRLKKPEPEPEPESTAKKLILKNGQSPGDIVMLTACVRDLHKAYPGIYLTDIRTPAKDLWENNPYITPLDDKDPSVEVIKMGYPLINTSNQGSHHFIHGFTQFLEDHLGVRIKVSNLKGDIHLSEQEKKWYSQIYEIKNEDLPYWIIDAGSKNDFTAKQWDVQRYQEVVNAFPDKTFVQIGAKEHNHKILKGDNLIDLVGKTDMRQLIRLFYHSFGVITPVSLPMHLAAAVEMHPRWGRPTRPCIVIAGGREPSAWEAYSTHAYLHTCGMIDCCYQGGCWLSRTVPVGDKDQKDKSSLCKHPVKTGNDQYIPKCLDMITADDVIRKIKEYGQMG